MQCTRGIVDHIVLSGCDVAGEEATSGCRAALALLNPEADCTRVTGGFGSPITVTLEALDSLLVVNKQVKMNYVRSITTKYALIVLLRCRVSIHVLLMCYVCRLFGSTSPVPYFPALFKKPLCFDRSSFIRTLTTLVTPSPDYVTEVLSEAFDVQATEVGERNPQLEHALKISYVKGFVRFTDNIREVWQVDACRGKVVIAPLSSHQSGVASSSEGSLFWFIICCNLRINVIFVWQVTRQRCCSVASVSWMCLQLSQRYCNVDPQYPTSYHPKQ